MNMDTDELLNSFDETKDCVYKDEHYSVRNNGAVMRHARSGKRKRPCDNVWTFGKKDVHSGYMKICSVSVHRIVAFAFLGTPPSDEYVVDHIDTNRCNNRPNNLRWLTKLENILNNPITKNKIIYRCGSIENFLSNPAMMCDPADAGNKFDWMRTVTPQEAKAAYDHLLSMTKQTAIKGKESKGIGEWIYEPSDDRRQNRFYGTTSMIDWDSPSDQNKTKDLFGGIQTMHGTINNSIGTSRYEYLADGAESSWKGIDNLDDDKRQKSNGNSNDNGQYDDDTEQEQFKYVRQEIYDSLTPNAKQWYWSTPTTFPLCPSEVPKKQPLYAYYNNLTKGAVLSENKFSINVIDDFAMCDEGNTIVVRSHNIIWGLKKYFITKIKFIDGIYLHSGISYFEENGAKKELTRSQGLEWDGGDCIDDYLM